MAEAKTALGVVRDAWDTASQLGTFKGLLFVVSLAAFVDVACVNLGIGNLMTLNWKTPLPPPGALIWALAAFVAVPLVIAPFIQGLLDYLVGSHVQRFFANENAWPKLNNDYMLPGRLDDLALFEQDTQLEAFVQRHRDRWQRREEEADALMRQSWACTMWVGVALFTDHTSLAAAVWPAIDHATVTGYIAFLAAFLIPGPWLAHLATDPIPLRYLYVPGAWARYQRMGKRTHRPEAEAVVEAIG